VAVVEGGSGTGEPDASGADPDEFDPVRVLLGSTGAHELRSSAEVHDLLVSLEQEQLGEPRQVLSHLPDRTPIVGGVCSVCSSWIDNEVLDQLGYCPDCAFGGHVLNVLVRGIPLEFERERPLRKQRRAAKRAEWVKPNGKQVDPVSLDMDCVKVATALLRHVCADEYRMLLDIVRGANGAPPRRTNPRRAGEVVREIQQLLVQRAAVETLVAEQGDDR
jgi:hypothetical protein